MSPISINLVLLGCICILFPSVAAWADDARGYRNPVIRGYSPDPSICRVADDYYLVTGSNLSYPDIPVFHSKDLVHWRLIGYCLTREEHFFLDKNGGRPRMYAPTIRYHDGVFYMITTDVAGGGNFYVTATDPAGPWGPPVCVDRPMFDPSLFFDDDGKVYYTRRGEFADKDIVQAEIDIKTGKLLTPLRSISKGLVGDDTEAPHLFKRNGWYYLTMGEGGSRYLHMQSIARSKSLWGPFDSCPDNPVISQHVGWWHHQIALGHADFLEDHQGNAWAVCLGQRKAGYMDFCVIGRETFLFPVEWVDGWPTVQRAFQVGLTVETETLPLRPWPDAPCRDNFNDPTLALQWKQMAYPREKLYSLSERPGHLRLFGTASPPQADSQVALVGIGQAEMSGRITTRMEFVPKSANEEAGVAVYQGPTTNYLAYVTRREGFRVACLRKTVGDMTTESGFVPLSTDDVQLRIDFDTEHYRFRISPDGNTWQEIGSGLTNLVSTDVAQAFGGVSLCIYASGNGAPCTNPADFDWFEARFNEVEFE